MPETLHLSKNTLEKLNRGNKPGEVRRTPTVQVSEHVGTQGVHFGKELVSDREFDEILDSSSDAKYDDIYGSGSDELAHPRESVGPVFDLGESSVDSRVQEASDSEPVVVAELVTSDSSRRLASFSDILRMAPSLSDLEHPEDPVRRKALVKEQKEYIAKVAQSEGIGMPKVLAERMRLLPYTYLPLRRLATQGAMGTVYEVADLGFDKRRLIMKVFSGGSKKLFDRFKQEAQLAASIRNHHVGSVISADFSPDGTAGWYVMEKADGQDLDHTMDDRALPLDQALEMMAQTADGLAAVHTKGIVHRDLKPGNIMVHQEYDKNDHPMDPVYKIIDFGLAKQVEVEEGKLEWVKEQMLMASSAEELDASLKKYGFSDSQRASATELYEAFHIGEDVSQLRDKNWKQTMRSSRIGTRRLESLRRFAEGLPRGNKDLAYDLYLASIDRAKREWVRSEVHRLASLGKPSARLVRRLQPFIVPDGVIAGIVQLAKEKKDDPDFYSPEEIDVLAEEISIDPSLSQVESTIGTPLYMSPEQVRGDIIDTKSDVFSLGVVWYESVSGIIPHKDKGVRQTMQSILSKEVPALNTFVPGVSPRLGALIARMMEKDPAQRPTMKEVKAEIAAIRAEYAYEQAAATKPRVRTPESDAETGEVKKRVVSPDDETSILPAVSIPSSDKKQSRVVKPVEQPATPPAKTFLERARERLNNLFGR